MNILITKYNPSKFLYQRSSDSFKYEFQSFINTTLLPNAVRTFDDYSCVGLFSHRAIDWILNYGLHALRNCHFVCLSQKQSERLRSVNLNASAAEGGTFTQMTELILEHSGSGKVLILKGDRSMEDVSSRLKNKTSGIDVRIVYKTTLESGLLNVITADAVLFYSPTGVEGFLKAGNRLRKGSTVFAIGDTTAKAVREKLKTKVIVSPVQEEAAYIQFVRDELSGRKKQLAV